MSLLQIVLVKNIYIVRCQSISNYNSYATIKLVERIELIEREMYYGIIIYLNSRYLK